MPEHLRYFHVFSSFFRGAQFLDLLIGDRWGRISTEKHFVGYEVLVRMELATLIGKKHQEALFCVKKSDLYS